MQWGSIAPHFDGSGRPGDVDPEEGSIPPESLAAAILEHCPTDHDVTYAVWVGFGSWSDRGDRRAPARVGWPGLPALRSAKGSDHDLARSSTRLAPVRQPDLAPSSWCIATEIDWDSTLIAGPYPVTQGILDDERLETFEVDYGDDLSWYGDHVNPLPDWLRARR